MAALSEIEKLEARWAENPDGRYFAPLADAYRKAGRVDEAITVVTSGLNRHPDYLSAHIVLGRCHLEKKDDPSAKAAFEKVLGLDSENIIALKSLAEIAERTGAPDDARRWLQRLLTIDAMNAEAAEDLARLGGPISEDGGTPAVEPAEDVRISFADLAPEPEPSATSEVEPSRAVTAVDFTPPQIPRTRERPVINPDVLQMANDRTLDMMPAVPPPEPEPEPASSSAPTTPVPALEFESTAFQPPSPEETPAPVGGEFVPFDDQLQWGAGERQSQAIHAEDIAEAEAHHEATAAAIDFIGGAPPAHDAPAPDAAVHHEPEPEPMSLEPASQMEHPSAGSAWEGSPEVPDIHMPASEEAPAAAGDLHLIMPEDVTPAEELRRPSSKQVQMVSPEPVEAAAPSGVELMVTETMGDLYLRQGFKDQAAEVYRRLLTTRPGDAGLLAKIAAIESPPAFSASAMGSEAVGPWLRRIAKAQLPTQASAPPPAPETGPTPMEQAFSTSETEAAPAPEEPVAEAAAAAPAAEGNPARPATDAFSLDQIFGGQGGGAAPAPAPAPAASPLGASFDEFFGAAPKQETVRPKEGAAGAGRQSEDDLSAFNAWLHGLKR